MPENITETAEWVDPIQVPAASGDTHGFLKSTTIQKICNRLKYIKDRMTSGFEHPFRHGTKAAMVALTGMTSGDMFYATDVDRVYRWQSGAYSAEFTTDADNIVAGTSGYWVRANLGGFHIRNRDTKKPNTVANTSVGTSYTLLPNLSAAVGKHKTGDILKCEAHFTMGSLTTPGQCKAKLVYYNGSTEVDIGGSEMFLSDGGSSNPLRFSVFGEHTIIADKPSGEMRVYCKTAANTGVVDYDATTGFAHMSRVEVLVP